MTPCASSLPDDAGVALHRVQVAIGVAAAERHSGDEVMQDEVVEDDDAWPPPQRVDDPAVRVGVVSDVVERDVRPARRPPRSTSDDDDLQPLLERRQQQRAVVGDPRPLGRKRRVVGDLHEPSSRSTSRPR